MNVSALSRNEVAGFEDRTVVAPHPPHLRSEMDDPSFASFDDGPTTVAKFQERFGRYLLVERLGQGGMAEVHKAVWEGIHGFRRVLAIKRILPQYADSDYFIHLLAKEARACALMNHPNLIQVHEFGVVGGVHYLAMEYLDGLDLASLSSRLAANNQRFAPSVVSFVAQQVALGLSHAHAAAGTDGTPYRLVHRDVSPENIMLTRQGGVKLIDFGIVLFDRGRASPLYQGAKIRGKPGYTSPEHAAGLPLDGRSDVFSLGVVMWEMLTGLQLFADSDDLDHHEVLRHKAFPPSQVAHDVPPALDNLVMRALALQPSDRPTANALAAELDEVRALVPFHRQDLLDLLTYPRSAGTPRLKNDPAEYTRDVIARASTPALLAPLEATQTGHAAQAMAARPEKRIWVRVMPAILAAILLLLGASVLSSSRTAGKAAAHATVPGSMTHSKQTVQVTPLPAQGAVQGPELEVLVDLRSGAAKQR